MSICITFNGMSGKVNVQYFVKDEYFKKLGKTPEELHSLISNPRRTELKEPFELMQPDAPNSVAPYLHRTDGPAVIIHQSEGAVPETMECYFLDGEYLQPDSDTVKKIKANESVTDQINTLIFDKPK